MRVIAFHCQIDPYQQISSGDRRCQGFKWSIFSKRFISKKGGTALDGVDPRTQADWKDWSGDAKRSVAP